MAIFAFFGELGVALSVRPFTPSFLRPPNIGDPCALGLSIVGPQSPHGRQVRLVSDPDLRGEARALTWTDQG